MTNANLPSSRGAVLRPLTRPLLIIVSGPPGSGKTTLARRIANDFHLPLIAKDDIKESLFDSLGWQDREWSKRLGRATYDLIYYFVETQLGAGNSLIVESNFHAETATGKFCALLDKYNFVPFQILCYAEPGVLIERFKVRWASGNRHPGHIDKAITAEEYSTFRKYLPLDIGGTLIETDTTDFGKLDYAGLYTNLHQAQQGMNEVQ